MFDEIKATAIAIAFLQQTKDKVMNYTKLIKLMYLSDRTCLIRNNYRISNDVYVNMHNGVVLSNTYYCIKEDSNSAIWNDFIKASGKYSVKLIDPKKVFYDILIDEEKEIINGIYEQYSPYSWKQLVDQVIHKLPEWEDPYNYQTKVRDFNFYNLLKNLLHKSDDEIKKIKINEQINDSDISLEDIQK